MYSGERPITEAEFNLLKPEGIDVFRFLNLDTNPTLTEIERRYLRLICRNVPLIQKPSYVSNLRDKLYHPEGYYKQLLGLTGELYEGLIHHQYTDPRSGSNFSEKRELSGVARELSFRQPLVRRGVSAWSLKAVRTLFDGNFLLESLRGRGECLDLALSVTLAGRLSYRHDVRDIQLLPYNITSQDDLRRRKWNRREKVVLAILFPEFLGHDHYGAYWREGNEDYLAFLGIVVPSSVIEQDPRNRRAVIGGYLKDNYPGDPQFTSSELDRATVHAVAINRAKNRTLKH